MALVRGEQIVDRVMNQVELTLLASRRTDGLHVSSRAGSVLVRHKWAVRSGSEVREAGGEAKVVAG